MSVFIPDTSDQALLQCAASFDRAFTAEEFCQRLYKSDWGYGPFVSGKLRRLVSSGRLETWGKSKGKTLYALARHDEQAVSRALGGDG